MQIADEDVAYETSRQRKVDSDWTTAEDAAASELSFRQEQKELEMNHHDIALTATFMVGGMLEYDWRNCKKGSDGKNTENVYQLWGQNELKLHLEMVGYAKVLQECCDEIGKDSDVCFPGVIDYEVSEPFGAWYAKQLYEGRLPTREEGVKKLKKLIAKFFAQEPGGPREYLYGFYMGVMRGIEYV